MPTEWQKDWDKAIAILKGKRDGSFWMQFVQAQNACTLMQRKF